MPQSTRLHPFNPVPHHRQRRDGRARGGCAAHQPRRRTPDVATTDTSQPQAALGKRLRQVAGERFNLRDDKADDEEIEARIRDAVELRGATPWILVFAILVASVGLNVNSTAVIIGAMLISPLMAPIMGAGFGVAVYDFALVKRSLTNLLIATLISLVVSWTYFSLTPLHQAQSELLHPHLLVLGFAVFLIATLFALDLKGLIDLQKFGFGVGLHY